MKFAVVAAIASALLGASAANAVVRYEFTALSSFNFDLNDGDGPQSFTGGWVLETASPIAPGASYLPAALLSCSAVGSVSGPLPCSLQEILTGFYEDDITISFGIDGKIGIYYYFQPESLYTNGLHETTIFGRDQAGTLVVSGARDAVIPEPATWAMMIAGFGLVGAAARRRRGVAASA